MKTSINMLNAALFLSLIAGPAVAQENVVGVPAPEMGGAMLGPLLAAGALYLIKRRGRRS